MKKKTYDSRSCEVSVSKLKFSFKFEQSSEIEMIFDERELKEKNYTIGPEKVKKKSFVIPSFMWLSGAVFSPCITFFIEQFLSGL